MRRSYWIAGTIALLATGWLASGMLFKPDEPTGSIPTVSAEAAQRVYAELLRMAKPDAAVPGLWVVRPLPPMHEIASLTGTTRETVNRAISQLYPSGLLKRKGRNLFLMEREKLMEIVQSLQVHHGRK